MSSQLSAVICTRNRPESLVRSVRSLLDTADEFDLIVVDQSDGTETDAALAPIHADSRLRYYRSQRRGKGAALNEALALARGAVVVVTDDDCLAPPGWVAAMTRELLSQPNDTAIVFCQVAPVPHDKSRGFVPAYQIARSRRLQSVSDACGGLGIGAGMAVHRDIVKAMGGFDELIGPGAKVPAGDDWDIAMRALLMGYAIYETATISIVHDGFRTFADGRAHARRDWQGMGTVFAKPLRAGRWEAAVVPARKFSVHAVWPVVLDVLSIRKPRGVGRIIAFVRGFIAGLSTSVDKETLRFVEKRRELHTADTPVQRLAVQAQRRTR